MTDRERALELLTRIVTANESTDPGCTARECLVALEGLGYRPTNAAPPPVHAPGAGLPKREDAVAAVAELKAQLAPRDGDAA